MVPPIVLPLFFTLFGMVWVWFGLVFWFFRRLRLKHSGTWEAMGSPSLFWNNSPRSSWLFMKFLFTGAWKKLDDPALSAVAWMMLAFHAVYITGFVVVIALTWFR
jgi:hypothetical protein